MDVAPPHDHCLRGAHRHVSVKSSFTNDGRFAVYFRQGQAVIDAHQAEAPGAFARPYA
jgi:hypothetical protein